MLPILEFIEENVVGGDTRIVGPYGEKKVIYCDYTASGKPLRFIENYIRDYVLPFYSNTHTTTSATSRQTTKFRNEARNIIKSCVNATGEDCVVFTGSGTTSAIHKLIHALELEQRRDEKNVVFIGPFEHHSNILPWRETGIKIERINDNEEGTVDMDMLEEKLQMYRSADYNIYVAFSAASNVTGILTDTVAVAELCHKYGALSFWDYASAAPYLKIDMNPTPNGYKDAVFLSPHKFVGGPGTPGLLIAKKSVFRNPVPGGCGGGTVLFVTRDTHLYLKDIEEREEGGTPAIVESIRAGMVFQLKQSVGTAVIEEREEQLCKKAFDALNDNPNLTILGNDMARRLPIFSMIFYHQDSGKLVHHNFVSVLLNDLYGIQARGGCACAGPYAQELLGLNETLLRKFMWFLEKHENESLGGLLKEPLEIMKPGFVRVGLPYFMNDKTVDFVLNAVNMVATHGWKLLPQYHFDPHTGAWEHKQFKKDKGETLFSLYDVSYDEVGMSISSKSICRDYEGTLDDIAESARRVFEDAVNVNKEISTVEDEVVEFTDDKNQLVWFLQPYEAQFFLAAETLKYKPKPFGKAKTPFTPIHGHSPQMTPASSNPSLHLYTVKPDSDTSRSAESSESEDHVHNCVAREAWGPGEITGSYSGGKKKRNCFCKLKRVLQKIGK
ncbi:hypothetical protein ABFA07_022429 [Porites harrisoni]